MERLSTLTVLERVQTTLEKHAPRKKRQEQPLFVMPEEETNSRISSLKNERQELTDRKLHLIRNNSGTPQSVAELDNQIRQINLTIQNLKVSTHDF